jgi:hypothetical protein
MFLKEFSIVKRRKLIPILYEVALNEGLKPLVLPGFILCKLKLNWYTPFFKLQDYVFSYS